MHFSIDIVLVTSVLSCWCDCYLVCLALLIMEFMRETRQKSLALRKVIQKNKQFGKKIWTVMGYDESLEFSQDQNQQVGSFPVLHQSVHLLYHWPHALTHLNTLCPSLLRWHRSQGPIVMLLPIKCTQFIYFNECVYVYICAHIYTHVCACECNVYGGQRWMVSQ